MTSYTVDLRGDASGGWGLPLPLLSGALSPHLHGAALGMSPGLCSGGGGSQGSLDRAEPGSLQSSGKHCLSERKIGPIS